MRRSPLLAPALAYLRASAALRRWLDQGERLAGAFLSSALSSDEKSELGIRLYDASPRHRGGELFPGEQAWLARRLPPAPARLLVGGCGAGRELLALVAGGYAVDAFEPAPSLCRDAQARVGERARVVCCRYEELSAALLDGEAGPAQSFAGERYDAVLLGWGSLTHVLDGDERTRTVRTLDRLCPRGPILASFLCDPGGRPQRIVGRADRLGAASGRRVARLRGLDGDPAPGELFALHIGFAHRFVRDEIEALARAVGRAVVWEDDGTEYPHVSFVRA